MTFHHHRRSFLRKSLGTLGAASALSVLPPSIRRALAVEAAVDTGTIQDIKHVVILMMENRSFTHYFGTMRGVRGFGDRFPVPLESGKDVWFQSTGTKEIPPYHMDKEKTAALLVPAAPHGYSDSQAAWNQGKFGQWPRFKTEYSMGHYQREDIPFQFALAEAFTICDGYHCSVTTGTDPNRVIFFSGSNFNPELRKRGINCTDADAEINNLRCETNGTMPTPGYKYTGSAFQWPTLPDLLENAGVSWKIYQDPNNNSQGLFNGCLAFQSFRDATVTSGSPLYEKGLKAWTIADLRNDVLNGTLPAVTWILPTGAQSEHPDSSNPAIGADFTAQVLDALTASADTWSKTVLFLTYDENDGQFDHLPAPAVPSFNADGSLAGKSTVPLDGEYFDDSARAYLNAADLVSGGVRPWGLSARVPMYAISPWSKGGWVNSQVFDHTSMGMFLEKRFGITVDAISPWHRAVSGDLTSCFDFVSPNDPSFPSLPDASNYAAVVAAQGLLPLPHAPATPDPLFQETGVRFSRALPYELHTSARVEPRGLVSLLFANSGQQGAVFHVYDRLHLDRIPRRYTIEAGKTLSDFWNTAATDSGKYELWVYGTNGFVRTFKGDALFQATAGFQPEVQVCYEFVKGQVYLKVHNTGTEAGSVTVTANTYRTDGPWPLDVAAGDTGTLHWDLDDSGHWYDFTVASNNFERRFSGRVETGKPSVSDPAMALHLAA
jgi:phospholipase C